MGLGEGLWGEVRSSQESLSPQRDQSQSKNTTQIQCHNCLLLSFATITIIFECCVSITSIFKCLIEISCFILQSALYIQVYYSIIFPILQ